MDSKTLAPAEILGPLNEVEQKHSPEKLYLVGEQELLRSFPRVSIIGTRHPSAEGRKRTVAIARALVARQVAVVSGLAEGIDTTAHETAIAEKGGRTVAVLGTPLDRSYPRSNAALQEKIGRDHLLVSEFPSGHSVRPSNFPRRNRTMALVSHATVIVEAGKTSGTLHQGWEALRLGRPLFIVESLFKRSDLDWPEKMRAYGAQVLTRETLEALFDAIPQGNLSADLPF